MIFLVITANCDIVYICHSTLQFLIRNGFVYYPLKTCDLICNPKKGSYGIDINAHKLRMPCKVFPPARWVSDGKHSIQRAENTILSDIRNHFVNTGQRIRFELCKSVDGLGIVNNHPLFMVFISRYLDLVICWAL